VAHSADGPGNSEFVGTVEAARWLGINRKAFDRLVAEPWVSCWLHARTLPGTERKKFYDREDIRVLAHILKRRGENLWRSDVEKRGRRGQDVESGDNSPET
jgi:hypothetical protein